MKTTPTAGKAETMQVVCVCVFLVLAVLAVFGQTAGFHFVNYDDGPNVYDNPVVKKGLSVPTIGWAFTHSPISNWIPLTTLSHIMDCQLFGLNAGSHHLVNVLVHAANAVLLFLVLRRMTGSLWRSAFVAAVFAVHPLRAESVAWVSERKDVLSGLFFMLALLTYLRYVENQKASSFASSFATGTEDRNATEDRESRKQKYWYALTLVFFALGLLAKSMVATLPFVLLLLDWWPLGRMERVQNAECRMQNAERGEQKAESRKQKIGGGEVRTPSVPIWGLVKEKIPFFLLSAGSCVAAVLVPGLVVNDARQLSLLDRIANALISYVVYLRQMVFPAGLATSYPNPPNGQPNWEVFLACVLLAAISSGVVPCQRKRQYLLAGWLWYLGMLVPVIGIVQISQDAAHADRYTYLPEIGLAIAGTWAVADWSARWRHRQAVLGGLMTAVIGALAVCGRIQTCYWRDSETLWNRTLSCTSDNSLAHYDLGMALLDKGAKEQAIAHFRKAIEIKPDYAKARNNLGVALFEEGAKEEAIAQYHKVLEFKPDDAEARSNLGVALFEKGDRDEAIAQYRRALKIDPKYPQAEYNLGNALASEGQLDEAIAHFREALKIKPDYARAWSSLGLVFFQKGDIKEAIDAWEKGLEVKPDQPDVQNNLAWLLATALEATLRNGPKAVALAERANQLNGGSNAPVLHTLAAAYAEMGRFGDARTTARRALDLAVAQKNGDLTAKLPEEIKLYEENKPVRDTPQ